MNLHGLVSGAVGTVNPFIDVTVQISTGDMTRPDGARVPLYDTQTYSAQIQALESGDLRQIESLNLQGTFCKIYFYGLVEGIVRDVDRGGDLVTVPSGVYTGTWLTKKVFEAWPDWCSIACVLQNTGRVET